MIPDEGMLAPLLNTIPEEIVSVNVTMGYPMSGSAIHSLMKDVAALQLHLRKKKDGWVFYHAQVWAVLASGIFQTLAGEEGKNSPRGLRMTRNIIFRSRTSKDSGWRT